MRQLKRRMSNSATACGMTYLASSVGRDEGFTILTYHRIVEQPDPFYGYATPLAAFERHLQMLRRFCAVLSLDEIFDRMASGTSLPPRCVALTFDDGYRDLATLSGTLLARHRMPATLYATVDAMERGWLWPDLLRHALRTTTAGYVDLETLVDGGPRRFALSTSAERLAAVASLDARLKRIPDGAKWRVLEELAWKLLGRTVRDVVIPGLMLSWDDLRALTREGLTIGAHTLTHPILTCLGEPEAAQEIVGSKQRLEERLGRPVRHFAYPNGQPEDVSTAVRQLAKSAGFRSAVTTAPGYNRRGEDPWMLKRIDGNQESLRELTRSMAGAS